MTLPETPSSWRKSSRSTNTDNCVEVGRLGSNAAVRDTKDHEGGHFVANTSQWSSFITAIKTGRYDS